MAHMNQINHVNVAPLFKSVFNHIYVLNLEKCADRKAHIVNEFGRIGLQQEDYEFFKATTHDSEEVRLLMESPLVKKFPNCFRCNKKRCSCENNVLTPFQIANWCSFINMFKDILKNDYEFVLLCEDDVVFSKQSTRILYNLLSKKTFAKYRINMQKPLLIKMGAAYRVENHDSRAQPQFIHNYSLSNPCFAINKQMVQTLLSNLKIIDYHSDIYFHKKIFQMGIPNLQNFTMFPCPVFELSFVPEKQKFESTVRPTNGIRRIEYKEFLFMPSNFILIFFLNNYFHRYQKNGVGFDITNRRIGLHGNIFSYLLMNEHDKGRYFFENVIMIFDNEEEEIQIINNYFNLMKQNKQVNKTNQDNNLYTPIIQKIEELLGISVQIGFDENDGVVETLEKSRLLHKCFMEIIKKMKVQTNNMQTIYLNTMNETNFIQRIPMNLTIDFGGYMTMKRNILSKLV